MKLLLLAILATSITANATGNTPQGSTTNNFLNQIQVQHQTQENSSNAQGGSSSVNIKFSEKRRPVSSAIAPSVSSNVDCPIVSPASKAGSIWPLSLSGTTGVTLNPICVAYHLGQTKLVEEIACRQSVEYRAANANCEEK
jgi:hypothetical protein